MDPRSSAQDIVQCDICGSYVVEVFCAFCDVNLCRACIGKHVLSDVTKCHTFVGFYERNVATIFPRCSTHKKNICELHCRKCNVPVCTKCISSVRHEKHTFQKIIKIFKEKQKQMKADLGKLEKDFYEKYRNSSSEVEEKMTDFDTDCKNLKAAIFDHGEKWCKTIKTLVDNLTSEITKLENEHKKKLNKYKTGLEEHLHKVQQNMEQINPILGSNNISKSLKIKTDFVPVLEKPPKIDTLLPTFSPLRIPEELLSMWFGSLSSARDEITPTKIKQFLDKPSIIAAVDTRYNSHLYNVVGQSDGQIWTSGDDCFIKLCNFNQKTFSKSFETFSGHRPECIAMTNTGHLVYTDYHERSVNIVINEERFLVIRLENWIPHGVCRTSSGNLLVIMVSNDYKQTKVVRYISLKEKQTIQFDYKGTPLYSSGDFYRYITENRNLDICVSDHRAGAVVVVNQAGKLRFRYTGLTPVPKNKPFDPRGITTDTQSHILVADIENHCVHTIDQNGQFLRYIECGLNYPWGLSTDENDNLFVAQYDNRKVFLISYMRCNITHVENPLVSNTYDVSKERTTSVLYNRESVC